MIYKGTIEAESISIDGVIDPSAKVYVGTIQVFPSVSPEITSTSTTTTTTETGSFDTDAQSYFDRVEGTGATISTPHKTAISTFYEDLKSNGLYDKIYDAGLFVGGTATAHSKTMKGLNDITWIGAITHDANGILSDGATGYGNLGFAPSSVLTFNNTHISLYSKTNVTNAFPDFGARNGNTAAMTLILRHASIGYNVYMNTTTDGAGRVALASTDSAIFSVASRNNNNDLRLYTNGSQVDVTSTGNNSGSLPTINLYICAENNNGSITGLVPRQYVFWSVGNALSDAEVSTFNTIVEALQIALGRNN